MSCGENDYFIKTYIPYPLKFASNSNFVLADAKGMRAELVRVKDQILVKTWTGEEPYATGEIIDIGGLLTIIIEATDVTIEGDYDWRLVMTNQSDKLIGLNLYPSRIRFN